MQEILIYGGIGINIIGALFLFAYAMKYTVAFHKNKNRPSENYDLKLEWAKKRLIGFGLMILGAIILLIGCMI